MFIFLNSEKLILYRRIWQLSLPMILSNITVPLLGMTDIAVIGHLNNVQYMGYYGFSLQKRQKLPQPLIQAASQRGILFKLLPNSLKSRPLGIELTTELHMKVLIESKA